ncbi:MAG: D-alanine--D-alanine ligase [Acidobacteria bacterium]|nr:D-alanine--D-alanine ligase [Acidobacteriota bacterium]
MKRLRIGVVYGGRSGEHEVSLASAASVVAHLDPARYEVVPIRIEKSGRWTLADRPPASSSAADAIEQARHDAGRSARVTREVHVVARPGDETLLAVQRPASGDEHTVATAMGLDVFFPVLHGPYGEDGTVQGLFELANVPYVGAGVLASAAGMDKAVAKVLFAARGLRVADHLVITHRDLADGPDQVVRRVEDRFAYPVFVKPANLGSSVGISKARNRAGLEASLALAAEFDRKLVVEMAVPHAREIECAVLGNDWPEASVPGEIVPSREFYDYEAKYLDEGSALFVPARLDEATIAEVRRVSIEAFRAVDGAGMARVDFLLDAASNTLYLNEVNTIPGFTTISMYPKLWEASGVGYPALLDRLVALALERHAEKQRLRTSYV